MNSLNLPTRIFLGWIALIAAQVIAGIIVPIKAPAQAHGLEWLIASDFLIAGTLGFVSNRSNSTGWRLAAFLVAVPLSINVANTIDGMVFLKNSAIPWMSLLLYTCAAYAIVFPLWRYILSTGKAGTKHEFPPSFRAATAIWKFGVSDLLYLVFYFTAGTIIFPYVRDFYAKQVLPSTGAIVALQLLVRGPAFTGICLLLARLIDLPRWPKAVAVGTAFAVLSGIVPLLMPNPYFPDIVRWVHMAEVTSSNFLFGMIVTLIWERPKPAHLPREVQQVA
jgi:hypothetical protein